MKVYIIGANFNKYTLLKKIIDHLTTTYDAECEVVDWLSKKNLNPDAYANGDFYIYVEVEKIYDSGIYFRIEPDEQKKSIATKFAEANELLSSFVKDEEAANEVVDDCPFETEPVTSVAITGSSTPQNIEFLPQPAEETICIKKYTGKKSSVTGITVTINGEDHYISKEDFKELYELDNLLTKNNMVLKEIVVE